MQQQQQSLSDLTSSEYASLAAWHHKRNSCFVAHTFGSQLAEEGAPQAHPFLMRMQRWGVHHVVRVKLSK